MSARQLVSGTPIRVIKGEYTGCVGFVQKRAIIYADLAWVKLNGLATPFVMSDNQIVENFTFNQTIRNESVTWDECPWQPKELSK